MNVPLIAPSDASKWSYDSLRSLRTLDSLGRRPRASSPQADESSGFESLRTTHMRPSPLVPCARSLGQWYSLVMEFLFQAADPQLKLLPPYLLDLRVGVREV